jgi:hypothetical protein
MWTSELRVFEGGNNMHDRLRAIDEEAKILAGKTETEEFPLPVVENWDLMVKKSEEMADVIDRHLDFEERFQGIKMRPAGLCPEQRVSLFSDLNNLTK